MATRNKAVDLAKFIAAFFVVGIHTEPSSASATTVGFVLYDILFRTAVPFFAVCTGFYLAMKCRLAPDSGKKDREIIWKMARKVLVMYLFWSLFYLIILLVTWHRAGTLSMEMISEWLVLTVKGYSYYHLWYLSQLFWGLLFLYPIIRTVPVKFQYFLVILLWLFGAFCHTYSNVLGTGEAFVGHIGHLGALSASVGRILPLLLAGFLLGRRSDTGKPTLLLPLLFAGLLTFEAFTLRNLGATRFSFIIFTLPLAVALFHWIERQQVPIRMDTRIFAKSAGLIYLIHPAVIFLIQTLLATRA